MAKMGGKGYGKGKGKAPMPKKKTGGRKRGK